MPPRRSKDCNRGARGVGVKILPTPGALAAAGTKEARTPHARVLASLVPDTLRMAASPIAAKGESGPAAWSESSRGPGVVCYDNAWQDGSRKTAGPVAPARSGPTLEGPAETWMGVPSVLEEGIWGLPGGSSLPRLPGKLPRRTVQAPLKDNRQTGLKKEIPIILD
jgi:hypothetical protein